MALIALLLLGSPVYDAFEAPLDPRYWYVGVPGEPKDGALRIPESGWIVARGLPDEGVTRIEITFRHKGRGTLGVSFFQAKEPLSSPRGQPIIVSSAPGERRLVLTDGGAELDGKRLPWSGTVTGTFRLHASDGVIDVMQVVTEPRLEAPHLERVERETLFFVSTPQRYQRGNDVWLRQEFVLWDVQVALLHRRGETAFEVLQAPPRGAPVLGALVTAGDATVLALRASDDPLAMRDWSDEKQNLNKAQFTDYLRQEYALFCILRDAQRALNAAAPGRKDLEPMIHLAVMRHAENAHAAVALARTDGSAAAKTALAALKKVLGRGVDIEDVSAERLRTAAGEAAEALIKEPPPEWLHFRFKPKQRSRTTALARDLLR